MNIQRCIANFWISPTLGFIDLEQRRDGRIYGLKDGWWYIYRQERGGDINDPKSWDAYEPEAPKVEVLEDAGARSAYSIFRRLECGLCSAPAMFEEKYPHPLFSKDGEKAIFCSKECQVDFYGK